MASLPSPLLESRSLISENLPEVYESLSDNGTWHPELAGSRAGRSGAGFEHRRANRPQNTKCH